MFSKLTVHRPAGLALGVFLMFAATGLLAATNTPWFARTWQADEGLPDNAVVGIAQTPDGFLWVATQGGLVRFDGNQFRDFAPITEVGVPSGLLHGLTVDRRGRLWVAKDGGVVACVDEGRTTSLMLRRGSVNARAVTPVEDGEGNLWAAYRSVPSRVVRIRDGQVSYFGTDEGLPPGSSLQLACDARGQLWFATGDRIGVFRAGKFVALETVPGVQCLAAAKSGGVWICAGGKVMKFGEGSGLVLLGKLPSNNRPNATVAFEDGAGRLWVGTAGHGLFRWEDKAFVAVPVSHREILSLAEDREGSLWVGTRGGGLNRLRPSIVESQEIASGLPFEAVRSVCQDKDGTLWAVARSGVVARQRGSGWSVLTATNGWTIDDAMSVVPDAKGGVWIGTHYDGLVLWRDRVAASVTMKDGLAGNFARSLLSATNGDLWIGTASADGLHRLRAGKLHGFELPAGSGLVRALAMDPAGTLWAGTAGGFLVRVTGDVLVDETAGVVPRLQTIRCLHAGTDGSLWIGYGGSGVGRLKDGRFVQFRAEQGISDDYISQILDDGAGRLWFAGNKGVFHVREKEFDDQMAGRIARVRPVVFGRDEGLPALQASREAWPGTVRARDGRWWICMQTGMAVVHPDAIHDRPAPQVVIESVFVDGRAVAAYDAGTIKSEGASRSPIDLHRAERALLKIAAGSEQIAIEFTALSFASPRNVAFRFKLEGLELDWVEAQGRRVAYYSHLPPGKFRFRVTASDGDGNWNETGPTLGLEVLPYFWQTWWFLVLAGISVLGTLGGVVRYVEIRKMRFQVERAEREGAIERERARIAKDIHDDLGASLTEITLLSELAQGGEGPPEEIQTDMRKIAARTRHLTRALDATVWAVNPRNDTLESLVTYTCSHAEDYLKPAGIRCRLEVPERLPGQVLTAAVRHNVFLIVKEALHNVVKHAEATEVSLRIVIKDGGMTLVIEDNGKGFEPDTQGVKVGTERRHGSGLANMKTRAEENGGKFELRSDPHGGTRIQLQVGFTPQ